MNSFVNQIRIRINIKWPRGAGINLSELMNKLQGG